MPDRNADDPVLLVVDEPEAADVIAARDPTSQGVLAVGAERLEESRHALLLAMGARKDVFDPTAARYLEACVVAPASRQPSLIALVAGAVWPIVEKGGLYACEPPYRAEVRKAVSRQEAEVAVKQAAAPGYRDRLG